MSTRDTAELALVNRQAVPLRSLPGFRKDHFVPEHGSSQAASFLARIGASRIREDLDETFHRLRTAFAFRRTEITSFEADGDGTLTTPLFHYECSMCLHDRDPTQVIWQRKARRFRDANEILSTAFARAFPDTFDSVQFLTTAPIDIPALIDHLELQPHLSLSLQYDREATYCDIAVAGLEAKLRVEDQRADVLLPQVSSPQILMETFLTIQSSVIEFAAMPRISA